MRTVEATDIDGPVVAPDASDAGDTGSNGAHLVKGSAWFVASVLIGAVGGFALTWIATKVADPDVLGRAQSLQIAVLFVTYLSGMGLPVAVARYAAANNRTVNVLYSWALLYTCASSAVGTVGFYVFAGSFLGSGAMHEAVDQLNSHGVAAGALAFFAMVTGMSFTLLVEVRLVTLRQWRWVLARVLLVNGLRLPMLLVPTLGDTTLGLTALLVAVPAASGLLGVVVIRLATPARDRGGLFPVPDEARPALRYATVNYLGMLLAQGPQFTVPLIVSAVVAAEEASAFAVAWLICSVLFLIPHTVGQVLLAESSRAPGEVSTQVQTGLKLTAPTMALAAGATVAIGPAFVAFVFGDTYELTGDILATIVGAGVPWAFTAILLARARVLGHNGVGVVITGAFAVSTLGLVALSVGDGGVEAAADAWLAGNVIAALVAVGVTVATRSSGRAEVVASPEPA